MELDERDFFKEPFSGDELRALIGERSPSEVFSWKSPSFRKLGVDRGALDDEQLIAMMLEEPRLIRRPLIRVGHELIIGSSTETLSKALS